MAATVINGQHAWSMDTDAEGYRNYKIKFLVRCDTTDGPATVAQALGLPQPGDPWIIDNDTDLWVWCRPNLQVTPYQAKEGEPHNWWMVERTFSNKPLDKDKQKCADVKIEDPLLEPMKISGGFTKYTEEATKDLFGKPIRNSAHEQIRGPQNEWDASRMFVRIDQNVLFLELPLLNSMRDTVNKYPLWGLPTRCIKLSSISWERLYHGQCHVYYKRSFEFEIRNESFDRDILDEGTKVLEGFWDKITGEWVLKNINGLPPDKNNPSHFMKAIDRKGNPFKAILNGAGEPYAPLSEITCYSEDTGEKVEEQNINPPVHTDETVVTPPTPVTATLVAGGALAVGIEQRYVVTANGANGETLQSAIVSATPTTGMQTIRVSWPPQEKATRYLVYRGVIALGAPLDIFGLIGADTARNKSKPGSIAVVKYGASDFLLLGIPADL